MLPAFQAAAQNLDNTQAEGNFARDRNISIRDRPRPEYDAPLHRWGAFTVQPQLVATGEYTDNVYAAANNRISDEVLRLRPRIDLQSTWSVHAISAYAESSINEFADRTKESTTDYQFGGAGRLDILRGSNLAIGANYGRMTEARTSASLQTLSISPIRYRQADAYLAWVRTFNRLRISGRADVLNLNYEDGRTTTGAVLEQDDRDRNTMSLLGRADYAVSPDTALFVQVTGNKRDYRLHPPITFDNRESDGYEILGGANFELSSLIRGDFGVGYVSQKYDDPAFKTIAGFGARGKVEWFPTQLTTVTLTGTRSVGDSGIPGSAGFLSTNGTAQVDHELLRNLILTAQGIYGHDDYRDIDRTDSRFSLGVSATYFLNRRLGATLGYTHLDQSSSGLAGGQDYKINLVSLSLRTRF